MSTLLTKIKEDIKLFRKERNSVAVTTLQTLVGELETKEKNGVIIGDAEVISLINVFIKNNNSTLSMLSDQAKQMKLAGESILLNSYLPKRLSNEEVKQIISENTFESIKEGMDFFRNNYAGQYNGGDVSRLLKESL